MRVSIGDLMDEVSRIESELDELYKIERQAREVVKDWEGGRRVPPGNPRPAAVETAMAAMDDASRKMDELRPSLRSKRRDLARFEAVHRLGSADPSVPTREMDIVEELGSQRVNPRTGIASQRQVLGAGWNHLRAIPRLAPKALATGVAAKLMLGGAAKAAGLPGVGEAAEMAGREDPSLQQFFRETEEGITGALGLPQRSQMPVYSLDPAREGAARVMLRTGRENLRPGFDQPAITKQELEYVKKKAAPRAK